MENWQLALVVLGGVLVGAFLPLVVMLGVAIHRAGKEFALMGVQVKRTLTQIELISDRVEVLSRGFKDGETPIAALLDSVGHVANGLERNMKAINVVSTVMASVGTAIAAYVTTRRAAEADAPPAAQAHPPVAAAPP